VSCAVDSVKKSSDSFEDLLGGLGPDEGVRVVVPGLHPGSDVGFEGLDAAVIAAVEQVLGEVGEPAFDLCGFRRNGAPRPEVLEQSVREFWSGAAGCGSERQRRFGCRVTSFGMGGR
jgi:hypothetical protein